MKTRIGGKLIASTALLVLMSASAASAAGTSVPNGDFEAGAPGDSNISGWTSVNERIDLGTDTIASCTTVDTSDYATLRDFVIGWDDAFSDWNEGFPVVTNRDPVINADSLSGLVLGSAEGAVVGEELFEATIESGALLPDGSPNEFGEPTLDLDRSGNILQLFSEMVDVDAFEENSGRRGYVVHGPAVFSEEFTAKTTDEIPAV